MDFETLQRRLLGRVRTSVRNGELTERGLARMIGISQPHMHHILKGVRALSLENADRILRRLDLTVLDLIEGLPFPGQTPELTPALPGIEQNEKEELSSVGVVEWGDAAGFGQPEAQSQEAF
jgi:hypothetical protein